MKMINFKTIKMGYSDLIVWLLGDLYKGTLVCWRKYIRFGSCVKEQGFDLLSRVARHNLSLLNSEHWVYNVPLSRRDSPRL